MEERVSVLMTREDAALWVLFNQHYDNIGFMVGANAFTVKKGKFTIDVDSAGRFQRITTELSTSRSELPL